MSSPKVSIATDRDPHVPGPTLSILHVLVSAGPTNGQYNEHCLPLAGARRITVCSLLPPSVDPHEEIRMIHGSGSAWGALRSLREALRVPHDVVHVHAPASAALVLLVRALRGGSLRNCVFTMQNSYANYRARNRALLYAIFATFPSIVVCGRSVSKTLPYPLRRIGSRKVSVVPNAVDTERVHRVVQAAEGRGDRAGLRVVAVGRLVEIKDPLTVLRAFAEVATEADRLVFVGDGDLRDRIEQEADHLEISGRVMFTGLVERDEVYRRVAGADVFISASHGEGLPLAVLEAMSCGRPVIVSDIPPHREITKGADFVPLVQPGDVAGFAHELRRVRDMPEHEWKVVGDRCRRLVEDRFGLSAMHDALGQVYERARRGQAKAPVEVAA